MDVDLVNPFIEGVLHILSTTATVQTKPESPYLKKNRLTLGDITGVMEINGDVTGAAAIGFSKAGILGVVSSMFGEKMTEINEEITDAVGELTNMIAGQVTTKITESGKQAKVKFSRVIVGKDQELSSLSDEKHVLVMPFRTTVGKVFVEVCYQG